MAEHVQWGVLGMFHPRLLPGCTWEQVCPQSCALLRGASVHLSRTTRMKAAPVSRRPPYAPSVLPLRRAVPKVRASASFAVSPYP